MARSTVAFGMLVLAQAAHSVEECVGRLWESFPPAHFIAGLISDDRASNFVAMNAALVAFGAWCFLWPIRREWASARFIGWAWVALEVVNGVVHSLWTLHEGRYSPGVATAPILLVAAAFLAHRLAVTSRP